MRSVYFYSTFIFLSVLIACRPAPDINAEIARCDSAEVTRVLIKQSDTKTELLRKDEGFFINERFKADPRITEKFLELPEKIMIKMPASKADNDSLQLAVKNKGIDIRFFKQDKLLCRWLVGEYSPKYKGTPLMNAGAERIFITELPENSRFDFSSRCRVNPDFWSDKTITELDYYELSQVQVQYFGKDSLKSFHLKIFSDSAQVFDYQGKKTAPIKLKAVGQYLSYFSDVNFYKNITGLNRRETDSILSLQPEIKIRIINTASDTVSAELYPKINSSGNRDLHLAYARLNHENRLRLVKYYAFDLILKDPDYFQKKLY